MWWDVRRTRGRSGNNPTFPLTTDVGWDAGAGLYICVFGQFEHLLSLREQSRRLVYLETVSYGWIEDNG